jgi:hypothetical protein
LEVDGMSLGVDAMDASAAADIEMWRDDVGDLFKVKELRRKGLEYWTTTCDGR